MASTEAQKRAAIKYQKSHVKRIPFDLPLENNVLTYARFRDAVEKSGETAGGFLKKAILMRIENEGL